jgi:hypothetical protein
VLPKEKLPINPGYTHYYKTQKLGNTTLPFTSIKDGKMEIEEKFFKGAC